MICKYMIYSNGERWLAEEVLAESDGELKTGRVVKVNCLDETEGPVATAARFCGTFVVLELAEEVRL